MKTITLVLFFLISISCSSQKKIQFTTTELKQVTDNYGIDSALKIIEPFCALHLIDTSVSVSLALHCDNLRRDDGQQGYFSMVAQRIKNTALGDTALQYIRYCKDIFVNPNSLPIFSFIIPDDIIHVIVFQNNPSTIILLKENFIFWEQQADSIHKKYPSKFKLFLQSFKDIPPMKELYSDCKQNSFKLAWALKELGQQQFTVSKLDTIRKEMVPYLQDYNMDKLHWTTEGFNKDTITLSHAYSAIEEIDLSSENNFKKYEGDLTPDHCWKKIITNKNKALYETGCRYGHLNGGGQTFKLELISPTQMVITLVTSWMS